MAANHQLGQTIQKLLRERGMKPIELAHQAQIDRGQLSRILQGRSSPSLQSLERIAAVLGVPAGSLLEGKTYNANELVTQLQRDSSLALALRSLQKLPESDKAQVITIIERFVASARSI